MGVTVSSLYIQCVWEIDVIQKNSYILPGAIKNGVRRGEL